MWAYAYEEVIGLDHLRRVERDDPVPKETEIVVELLAASINYRDLAIARADYHAGVQPPLIPLSDGAGTVVQCGDGVTRFAPGDLVCPLYLPDWIDGPISPRKAIRRLGGPSDGVYRQYICLDQNEAVRAPAHLDALEAATLPVAALTAWHAIFAHGSLQPGMTLLVQGAGGVASFAIQFGKLTGAKVIVLVRNDAAAEAARALGADAVILAADARDWPVAVRKIEPEGVDRVIDISGTALNASIACCRGEAMVHMVGYAGGTAASLDLFTAIRHAITLRAASAGHRASFEQMVRAIEKAALQPRIGARFTREEFGAALALLGGSGRVGKIVLDLQK